MTSQKHHIEVEGLWKVFGDQPERAIGPEYTDKSRAEIQEELDLVVALRDVTFGVATGEIFVVMGLSGQRQVNPRTLLDKADRIDSGAGAIRWRGHFQPHPG